MNYRRRDFIRLGAGLLGGGFALAACNNSSDTDKVPEGDSTNTTSDAKAAATAALGAFGLQLYTLRDDYPKDVKGILKKVADMGYTQIEGYEGDKGVWWGMSNTEFKTYCDSLGLTMISSHCNTDKDFEKKAADAKAASSADEKGASSSSSASSSSAAPGDIGSLLPGVIGGVATQGSSIQSITQISSSSSAFAGISSSLGGQTYIPTTAPSSGVPSIPGLPGFPVPPPSSGSSTPAPTPSTSAAGEPGKKTEINPTATMGIDQVQPSTDSDWKPFMPGGMPIDSSAVPSDIMNSTGQPELPFFTENGTLLINDYKQSTLSLYFL